MEKNIELYNYFIDNAAQLTEEWYENLDKSDPKGVYSSKNIEVIEKVKEQNNAFHYYFPKVFVEDKDVFLEDLEKWIHTTSSDQEHIDTPIHFIIREFIQTRGQYLRLIEEFKIKNDIPYERVAKWNLQIIETFDLVIYKFSEGHHYYSLKQLEAQQELIYELSSPVITLANNQALLPLVGDIDTARATAIFENTLRQCSERKISELFIDLSGVAIVDTMVAHQIFNLIDGLSLIGVKSVLSGIRPEIASTAVQLGISFNHISISSSLSKALEMK